MFDAVIVGGGLPHATPGAPVEHRAGSIPRLLAHGVIGWAVCAAIMIGLLQVVSTTAALVVRVIAAPLVFTAVAWHYFRPPGAREALPTAVLWTACVALLDLVFVAGLVQRDLGIFASILGTWLPFALIFVVTWAKGALMSTLPWPEGPREQART